MTATGASATPPLATPAPWQRNLVVCWVGSLVTALGMSLVMPFLPLYIAQLGVHDVQAVEVWSGLAFGVTFLMAAFMAPIYGYLADRFGRKLMLLRASLGMAIIFALTGGVRNVWQLTALRFLMGAVSGYVTTANILVATEAPQERSGWALGVLSTGYIAGALVGPLIGGALAEAVGLRPVFWLTGALLLGTFLLTLAFVRETWRRPETSPVRGRDVWRGVARPRAIWVVFVGSAMIQLALFAIEPILTVYIQALTRGSAHVPLVAGAVFAAGGVATLVAAPSLGRLSDRLGARRMLVLALVATAVFTLPQAVVRSPWELLALRFLTGVAGAALAPALGSRLRMLVPAGSAGRFFGYQQSAQYVGNIAGPLMGGLVAARLGIPAVFVATAALVGLTALGVTLFDPATAELAPELPLESPATR